MNAHDVLDMIGDAKGAYIAEAQRYRERNLEIKQKKAGRPALRRIAAVFALILAGMLLLQTPIGAAAVELVKASVSRLIETLFPPKDIIVMPEGTPEVVPHEAQGRDPAEESPGFVMYVDTESYVMTEENGVYYIRQIPIEYDREEIRKQQAAVLEGLAPEEQEDAIDQRIQKLEEFYASMPECEIEIREVPDKDSLSCAGEIRDQMAQSWDTVTDVIWTDRPLAYTFTAADGIDARSPYENHYFVDNGKQGTFHIISRFYQKAAEGHGTRFAAMIQTFTVVSEEETAQYAGENHAVLEAMRQEVASAVEQNEALLLAAKQDGNTFADVDAFAMERYELWYNTMCTLWPALEQKLDADTMQDLTALQLEWSTYKVREQEAAVAETQSAAAFSRGADIMEQRVYYLLNILEGTAPVQPRDPSTQLSPEVVVGQFMKAYYAGDREQVRTLLSGSYSGDIDVYTDFEPAEPVIKAIKGLDSPVLDMAYWGELYPSVEFRLTPDSDYFMYLSMTLTWEENQWKVSSYGLEG